MIASAIAAVAPSLISFGVSKLFGRKKARKARQQQQRLAAPVKLPQFGQLTPSTIPDVQTLPNVVLPQVGTPRAFGFQGRRGFGGAPGGAFPSTSALPQQPGVAPIVPQQAQDVSVAPGGIAPIAQQQADPVAAPVDSSSLLQRLRGASGSQFPLRFGGLSNLLQRFGDGSAAVPEDVAALFQRFRGLSGAAPLSAPAPGAVAPLPQDASVAEPGVVSIPPPQAGEVIAPPQTGAPLPLVAGGAPGAAPPFQFGAPLRGQRSLQFDQLPAPAPVSVPDVQALQLNTGGFTGAGGDLQTTAARQGAVGGLINTFGQQALDFAGLREQLQPGVDAFTRARIAQIDNVARRSLGEERESQARRGISGSSFGSDALARRQIAFGQERERAAAEGERERFGLQRQLIDAEAQARAAQDQTRIAEFDFQAQTGLTLLQNQQEQQSISDRLQSELGSLQERAQLAQRGATLRTQLEQFNLNRRQRVGEFGLGERLRVAQQAENDRFQANLNAFAQRLGLTLTAQNQRLIAELFSRNQQAVLAENAQNLRTGAGVTGANRRQLADLTAQGQAGAGSFFGQIGNALADPISNFFGQSGSPTLSPGPDIEPFGGFDPTPFRAA